MMVPVGVFFDWNRVAMALACASAYVLASKLGYSVVICYYFNYMHLILNT